MTCPFCGSPDVQQIGKGLYVCLDCGEQFSGYGYRLSFRLMDLYGQIKISKFAS